MSALAHFLDCVFHIIAQIIESIFVIRAIGNIAIISRFSGRIIRVVIIDTANGEAQEVIDLTHPFRVALCEIVIDCDQMYALAIQRIQICRQG